MWRIRRAFLPTRSLELRPRSHGSRPRTSIDCFGKLPLPMELPRGARGNELPGHDPGLRLFGRRPARRYRMGRMRPDEPEEPAPPLLDPGRENRWRRDDQRPDRHVARPARTTPHGRARAPGRRPVHARPCRPYARDRRSTAAGWPDASPDSGLCGRRDPTGARAAVWVLLRGASGQRISADPRATLAAGWRERRDRRARRCDSRRSFPVESTVRATPWVSASEIWPTPRT